MSEHTEQVALFEWAAWNTPRLPELALLMHIPNGGKRSRGVAGQLKAAGVKAGVPDLLLPVPGQGYHGLWIELKTATGRTSPTQRAWIAALVDKGYDVVIARNWQEAAWVLCKYLGADPAAHGLVEVAS